MKCIARYYIHLKPSNKTKDFSCFLIKMYSVIKQTYFKKIYIILLVRYRNRGLFQK